MICQQCFQAYCPAFQEPPGACPLTPYRCQVEHIHHDAREDRPELFDEGGEG